MKRVTGLRSKEEYYERKERQITAADISREIKEAMEDEKNE